MSRIIIPDQTVQQVGGAISYHIGKQGTQLSLRVSATDPLEAEFVLVSGTMQFLGRTIANAEKAETPEGAEEERAQYIDDLRAAYILLQALQLEISQHLIKTGFQPKLTKV